MKKKNSIPAKTSKATFHKSLRQVAIKKIDKKPKFLYKSEGSVKLSQNIDLPVKTFREVSKTLLGSSGFTHSFRSEGNTHSLQLLRKTCPKQRPAHESI